MKVRATSVSVAQIQFQFHHQEKQAVLAYMLVCMEELRKLCPPGLCIPQRLLRLSLPTAWLVRSVAQGGNRMSSMAGGSESKFIHAGQKFSLSKNPGGSHYPLLLGNAFCRYKQFQNYLCKQKLIDWHVPGLVILSS